MNIKDLIIEAHKIEIERGFYKCPKCKGTGKITQKHRVKVKDDLTLNNSKYQFMDKDMKVLCPICNGSKINPNRNIGEMLMMIVSELGKVLEAHKSGRFTNWIAYNLNIEEFPEYQYLWFDEFIKNTHEDKIADAFIQLFDLCGYLGIELENSFSWKNRKDFNIGSELFGAIKILVDYQDDPGDCHLDVFYCKLLYISAHYDIPIEKHIKAKMIYNRIQLEESGKRKVEK